MGRFYKTATPQYIEDTMFKRPWELIDQVMSKKQSEYDATVSELNVADDLNIKSIGTPKEKENAERIKQEYLTKIQDLQKKLEDPNQDWQAVQREAKTLSRTLEQDIKGGTIYKMEANAAALKEIQDQNKDLIKKNPHKWAEVSSAILQKWDEQGGSANADINDFYAVDDIKIDPKMIAGLEKEVTMAEEGDYFYKFKGIPKEKLREALIYSLTSDPTFSAYIQQEGELLGKSGYIEEKLAEDGVTMEKSIVPFLKIYDSTDKKFLSEEEIEKRGGIEAISADKTERYSSEFNPDSAFYSQLSALDSIYGGKTLVGQELSDQAKLKQQLYVASVKNNDALETAGLSVAVYGEDINTQNQYYDVLEETMKELVDSKINIGTMADLTSGLDATKLSKRDYNKAVFYGMYNKIEAKMKKATTAADKAAYQTWLDKLKKDYFNTNAKQIQLSRSNTVQTMGPQASASLFKQLDKIQPETLATLEADEILALEPGQTEYKFVAGSKTMNQYMEIVNGKGSKTFYKDKNVSEDTETEQSTGANMNKNEKTTTKSTKTKASFKDMYHPGSINPEYINGKPTGRMIATASINGVSFILKFSRNSIQTY